MCCVVFDFFKGRCEVERISAYLSAAFVCFILTGARDSELISIAAIGATMMVKSSPIAPPLSSLSLERPAPKMAAHCAMFAIHEITPAIDAATVEMRVSRCFTWESSCPITPLSSS